MESFAENTITHRICRLISNFVPSDNDVCSSKTDGNRKLRRGDPHHFEMKCVSTNVKCVVEKCGIKAKYAVLQFQRRATIEFTEVIFQKIGKFAKLLKLLIRVKLNFNCGDYKITYMYTFFIQTQ